MNQPLPIPPPPAAAPEPFWKRVRNTFLAGIAVLLPLAITVWLMLILYDFLNKPFSNLLATVSDWLGGKTTDEGLLLLAISKWPGLGLLVTLTLVMVTGFLARNLLGKHLVRWLDEFAGKLPLIRGIYSSVKQLSDTVFTSTGKQSFRRAVLVHFPNDSSYAIGFVTGEARPAAGAAAPEGMINVFVPTTPNPTSGFLLLVPANQTIALQMSVEDALKMVISTGIVTPPGAPGTPGAPGAGPAATPADG